MADVWLLRDESGSETLARGVEAAEMQVACERYGKFDAYICPVTPAKRWLCSNCEEAVTHGE